MKSLLTILALTFSVMFSSVSFAGWTKVDENVNGVTFYVDFERIRKHDGYVFWWDLRNELKPTQWGSLSSKMYKQGDCKVFRYKVLSFSSHKEPMGGGTPRVFEPKGDNANWQYPPPNSVDEMILKSVCSR